MPTISFDEDLLKAIHENGPDIASSALADAAGLSKSNIARSLSNHRKAGLVKTETLQLTNKGARLAGVSLSNIPSAERETEDSPASDTLTGASDTPAPLTAPWNQIRPSGLNYRKTFAPDETAELAASLLEKGQLQEMVVRRTPATGADDVMWEIVAGERRWRAFKELIGQGKLPRDHPIRIHQRNLDDLEMLEIAVMENRQRIDVHPLEEAQAIAALQDAKLEQGTKSDARAVCREIGEKLGKSERWAQIRVNMVRRLSPAAQQAMMNGVFNSVKWADELGRWPHSIQDEAIENMDPDIWNPIQNEKELKDWLRRKAVPAGHQSFKVEDYLSEGGELTEAVGAEQQYFLNVALAKRLETDFAIAKADRLTKKHGYGLDPEYEDSANFVKFNHARNLDPKPPKDILQVMVVEGGRHLQTSFHHPVVNRKNYQEWLDDLRAEEMDKTEASSNSGADSQPAPSDDIASGFSRSVWRAGAAARTEALRDLICARPDAAMAIALLATLLRHGAGPRLCRITDRHPNGDAGQVGVSNRFLARLQAQPVEGIDDKGWVTDAYEALTTLLSDPEYTAALFATRMADLTIDTSDIAGPGSLPEARALADIGITDPATGKGARVFPKAVSADWLDHYTRAQHDRAIDAYGLFLDNVTVSKMTKPEASGALAAAFDGGTLVPLEARFVDRDTMAALERRFRKGKPT